jgi:hypothetical protein
MFCLYCVGKTLIQKYECTDEEGILYKNVSTYSGWTATTRYHARILPPKRFKNVERVADVVCI